MNFQHPTVNVQVSEDSDGRMGSGYDKRSTFDAQRPWLNQKTTLQTDTHLLRVCPSDRKPTENFACIYFKKQALSFFRQNHLAGHAFFMNAG